VAIPTAVLHLCILRQRLLHGVEIYGEDNRNFWAKELFDWTNRYQISLGGTFDTWFNWRSSLLHWEIGVKGFPFFGTIVAYGVLDDENIIKGVRREHKWEKHFDAPWDADDYYFLDAVQRTLECWMNEYNADMINLLECSFYFPKFIDSQDININPRFNQVVLGPYHGPNSGRHVSPTLTDQPARVNQVTYSLTSFGDSAPTALSGMHVSYVDHEGVWVGTFNDLVAEVTPSGEYLMGMKLGFNKDFIQGLQLMYSQSEGKLRGSVDTVCSISKAYELDGFSFLYSPEHGLETLVLHFSFKHPQFPV